MKSCLFPVLAIFMLATAPATAQTAALGLATAADSAQLVPNGQRITPARNAYSTPQRGTAERAAIMDAARVPIGQELGQSVIFVVDVLRSDGDWVYLQATPRQPGGAPINWRATPFAEAWQMDAMSDVVMVLLRERGGGFDVVDYVIGPTDVHWYNWVDALGLPEALFWEN